MCCRIAGTSFCHKKPVIKLRSLRAKVFHLPTNGQGPISHHRSGSVGVPAPTFDSHDARLTSRRTRSSLRVPREACIMSASERSSLFFNIVNTAAALQFFVIIGHVFLATTSQRTLYMRKSQRSTLLCFSTMIRMPPPIAFGLG